MWIYTRVSTRILLCNFISCLCLEINAVCPYILEMLEIYNVCSVLCFYNLCVKREGLKVFIRENRTFFFVFTLKNVFIANGAFVGTEKAELHSLLLRTTAIFQQNKFSN